MSACRIVRRERSGGDVTVPVWPIRSAGTLRQMGQPIDDDRPRDQALSALPSVGVRVAAFAAILISGLAGGLIGYSLIELQCEGSCGLPIGIGAPRRFPDRGDRDGRGRGARDACPG